MALSIGELAGYLTLDDSKFEQGLKGAQGKFESAATKLKDAGKKLGIAAGAAAGAAIAAGVAANINTGKANDKLAAQLGLTERESQRIGKVAGGLYRDAYGDSIEGVNDAVGAVMSSIAGMDTASGKRLESVTAKALDFATAFEVDVQRAAQVAGQAVQTGLAKNATEAFDLLTAASQKVPSALREDVLDAADEYGQFFAGLGYDGEQAFAMLVDASKKGMYGIDKTGDAIKEFTIRATDMSTSSKDAYAAIGLSAGDMANDILAGGDKAQTATQKIIDGILGIKDPAKQGEAAIALFGTPIEDLNTKDIPAFLKSMRGTSKSMDDTAGASTRMGDALNDNFATRMEGWKRTASGFVQDGLMAIVKGFEKGGRAGKGWKGDLSEVGAFIKSPLLPAVKDLGRFVRDNSTAFKILGGVILTGVAAFKIYKTTVAVITAVTKGWTIAQRILNGTLRANPIGIVITVLALLVAALVVAYKKSATFRSVVKGAFDAVAAAGRWLWNNVLQPVFKFLVSGFANVMDMYSKMLAGLSKVPGFGWAKKASDAMAGAAEKARGLADDIRKIPDSKDVKITLKTPDLKAVSEGIDWVARNRESRITITKAYAEAGRDTQGGLQARAAGGPVSALTPYLVGERGPELYVPEHGGRIIPNHQLNRPGVADSGGRQVVIHQTFPTSGDAMATLAAAPGRIATALTAVGV